MLLINEEKNKTATTRGLTKKQKKTKKKSPDTLKKILKSTI